MANATLERPTEEATVQAERQVVALHLGGELYGADIACIHTVITPPAITPVPRSAPWVAGVINLRGRVLPVVDLRVRFGMPPLPEAERAKARIVVTETESLTAGLIVDGVSEVLRLPESAISAPSHLVAAPGNDCVTGIGRILGGRRQGDAEGERLILLLDIARILAAEDLEAPRPRNGEEAPPPQ